MDWNNHIVFAGLTVAIISLFLISIPDADAHKLLAVNDDNTMFQTATHIPDPFGDSYFTLEKFTKQGQSHWYSFNGLAGQEIFIQTLVPDIENSRNFTPCFDLLIGQQKVTPKVMKESFIEEFSNTNWIKTCELTVTLSESGFYYIRVHDQLHHYSQGDTGKFSLSVGTVDDFTIFDWMQVPFWMLHINLFFGNLVFVWIILTLLVIVAVLILVAMVRRREG